MRIFSALGAFDTAGSDIKRGIDFEFLQIDVE
jgi:hypothetical protein